jgi:hypothetical protein
MRLNPSNSETFLPYLFYVELISLHISERNILSLKSFMLQFHRDQYLMIYNLSNFLLAISVSETLVPGVSGTHIYFILPHTLTLCTLKVNTLTKLYGLPGCLIIGRKLNYNVMVFCKIICLKNNFCV